MNTNMTNDVVRVVIFVLAWVNSLLVAHGYKPIPSLDETYISWILTFIVSVWAMLKESPFKGMAAKMTKVEDTAKTVTSEAAVKAEQIASEAQVVADASKAVVAPVAPVEVAGVVQTAPVEAKTAPSEATQEAPKTN